MRLEKAGSCDGRYGCECGCYENVEIIHMVSMGKIIILRAGDGKAFPPNAFFLGGTTRAACAEGRADITPVYFSEAGALRTNCKAGCCACDGDAAGRARICKPWNFRGPIRWKRRNKQKPLAAVNKYPPTHGDSFVHVDEISDFVEFDERSSNSPIQRLRKWKKRSDGTARRLSKTATACSLNRRHTGCGAVAS